jgi:hypothetical protein
MADWQVDLFIPDHRAKEAAVARNSRDFRRWAETFGIQAVREALLLHGPEISTDEVRACLGNVIPPAPSTLGMAMTLARDLGWIENTGQEKNSKRKECHNRPITIWRAR